MRKVTQGVFVVLYFGVKDQHLAKLCDFKIELAQMASSVKARIFTLQYASKMDHISRQTVLSFCLWDSVAVGLDITLLAFNKVVIL